jgi:type I restriction enzyme S subunit
VQEAREATEAVIASARELKKSLMRHLFTYGPVPADQADQVPLKETEIGQVPEHWEVVRLGDLFQAQQGASMSPRRREGQPQYPFLRTLNVLWGRVDLTTLDQMHLTSEELARLSLKAGDLLVCEGGEIGRTALWRGQLELCAYQNHVHRLRAKHQDMIPDLYVYWMQAAMLLFGLYGAEGNRTTIPNLSQSRLSAFPVPLPPLVEQQEITSILSAVDRKIGAEENRKRALEALFKTLLHNLMTGKIRVRDLNTQQALEPA